MPCVHVKLLHMQYVKQSLSFHANYEKSSQIFWLHPYWRYLSFFPDCQIQSPTNMIVKERDKNGCRMILEPNNI